MKKPTVVFLLAVLAFNFNINCSKSKMVEEKYESGKLKSSYYALKDGKDSIDQPIKNGVLKSYYENGHLKELGNYSNGKRNGMFKFWYEIGQEAENVKYVNGLKDSVDVCWYDNGNKQRIGNYHNGKRTGKWTIWNSNGTLQGFGSFKDGYLNGETQYNNEKGETVFTCDYLDGRLQGWQHVYYNGKYLAKLFYVNNKIDKYLLNSPCDVQKLVQLSYINVKLFVCSLCIEPSFDSLNKVITIDITKD